MTTSTPTDPRPSRLERPVLPTGRATRRRGRNRGGTPGGNGPHQPGQPLVPRWVRLVLLATLAVIALAGATTAWLLTSPSVASVEPAHGTTSSQPTVVLGLEHASGLRSGDLHVSVDGRDVSSRAVAGRQSIAVRMPKLSDGRHVVQVRTDRFGTLHRRLETRWSFLVDTRAPALRLAAPAGHRGRSDSRRTRFTVVTERHATVAVAVGTATTVQRADTHGRASLVAVLREGNQRVRISTVDAAGNRTTRVMSVYVDSIPPGLASTTLPLPNAILKSRALDAQVVVRDATHVDVRATLDGRADAVVLSRRTLATSPTMPVTVQLVHADADGGPCPTTRALPPVTPTTTTTTAPAGAATGASNTAAGTAAATTATEDATVIPTAAAGTPIATDCGMGEGVHVLELTATDHFGHVARVRRSFTVDSTEQLGDNAVGPGARGADVRALQAVLQQQHLFDPKANVREVRLGVYGAGTTAAVKHWQSSHGESVDGIAGADTLAGLTLRIVISRTAHTLTLFRVGKVEKVYPVAVGQPIYPTPAGHFHIVSMQKNPTWTPPPDAAWAKGAKPIAAGPGNPLGTRWMGLDAPGGDVGMHGTDSPGSIGYSLSHGCIRMQIPDAEDLFDRVRIGTPVDIT